jgi:signal transduction histidine kinase
LENNVPGDLEMLADPLIIKVFGNLIDNSLRHGGGTTIIRFSVQEFDGVRCIVCEDDGIGVPVELKQKIFARGSGKDHGLGLFLSREILAITGISIKEVGEPNKGAKFVIAPPPGRLRGIENDHF